MADEQYDTVFDRYTEYEKYDRKEISYIPCKKGPLYSITEPSTFEKLGNELSSFITEHGYGFHNHILWPYKKKGKWFIKIGYLNQDLALTMILGFNLMHKNVHEYRELIYVMLDGNKNNIKIHNITLLEDCNDAIARRYPNAITSEGLSLSTSLNLYRHTAEM